MRMRSKSTIIPIGSANNGSNVLPVGCQPPWNAFNLSVMVAGLQNCEQKVRFLAWQKSKQTLRSVCHDEIFGDVFFQTTKGAMRAMDVSMTVTGMSTKNILGLLNSVCQ